MIPYIHRDISWLSFNYRVLQEAKDPNVPVFERIKFLAIYSSNLEEFFKVRVATLRSAIRAGSIELAQFDYDREYVLKTIHKIVNKQAKEFTQIFEKEIIPELANNHIYLKRRYDLSAEQIKFVEDYFDKHMAPFAQPIILYKQKIRPFLMNAALYLGIILQEKKDKSKKRHAIVKIPSDHLPRFLKLPSEHGKYDVILLDEIVRHSAKGLFPGYKIIDSFSIKLTRDADIDLTNFQDEDDLFGDIEIYDRSDASIIANMNQQLAQRNRGPATRFVYDRKMPKDMLSFLRKTFSLSKKDLLPEGRYHNNFDFFGFPSFGLKHLENPKLPPILKKDLKNKRSIFKAMETQDFLFYYPFHSYEHTIQFFEQAAKDPKVTAMKITQYRVAKKSRIMNALLKAAKSGKEVTVFVELKARFDEEANLQWSKRLKKAGVKVLFGQPLIKVHSKIALITKVEKEQTKHYAYLSTGNFHEKTAKLYGDYGLLTANPVICKEVNKIFDFLPTFDFSDVQFEHLLVGKINLREDFEGLIQTEITNAIAGKPAHIIFKMNSLEDRGMIEMLYAASQAGVKVDLIIRGICCLIPGIEGISENINIISIVDRFLEHARVFWFKNNNEPKVYLSSADFMGRNLNKRVEAAFPIYDETLRDEIMDIIHIQLMDNTKARIIDGEHKNHYQKNEVGEDIRSQIATYEYYQEKEGGEN